MSGPAFFLFVRYHPKEILNLHFLSLVILFIIVNLVYKN